MPRRRRSLGFDAGEATQPFAADDGTFGMQRRVNQKVQTTGSIARSLWASTWLKVAVRLVVGIGVTTFLILRSDVGAIGRALAAADPLGIVAAVSMNMALLVVSAFRWGVFIQALQVDLSAATTLRLTFIGAFFNAFLPTGVGGDAYKAVRIRTRTTRLSTSLASVLLDRIAGVGTLAMIGILVSGAVLILGTATPLTTTALVLSVGVVCAATFVLLWGPRLIGTGRRRWLGLRPRLRTTLDQMVVAIRTPTTVVRSMTLGFACQALGIAAQASLASALDLGIPLDVITLAFLTTTLASAIPLTINGLGIREAVLVWGLAFYGVTAARALAYALLILGVALVTSAMGGIVYALGGGESGRQAQGFESGGSEEQP
jgi:glycosyltransferase 2 family protein